MGAHENAPMTPLGRAVTVRRIEVEGWTARALADALAVSERTIRKGLARWCAEGVAGLEARSSRAPAVANKLAAPSVAMIILRLRQYGLTGAEIAARLHLPRTTVAGHLAAAGLGQLQGARPEAAGRLRPA